MMQVEATCRAAFICGLVGRDQHLVGAELLGVGGLAGEVVIIDTCAPMRMRELDAHVAEPAEPDDADLLARAGLPMLSGE